MWCVSCISGPDPGTGETAVNTQEKQPCAPGVRLAEERDELGSTWGADDRKGEGEGRGKGTAAVRRHECAVSNGMGPEASPRS